MPLTINEIIGILQYRYDPEEICDLLEISTEELLDRFDHKVEQLHEKLEEELEDG